MLDDGHRFVRCSKFDNQTQAKKLPVHRILHFWSRWWRWRWHIPIRCCRQLRISFTWSGSLTDGVCRLMWWGPIGILGIIIPSVKFLGLGRFRWRRYDTQSSFQRPLGFVTGVHSCWVVASAVCNDRGSWDKSG